MDASEQDNIEKNDVDVGIKWGTRLYLLEEREKNEQIVVIV